MSERTKLHLDEVALDEFIVELRQPQVCLFFNNYTKNYKKKRYSDIWVLRCDFLFQFYARVSLVFLLSLFV